MKRMINFCGWLGLMICLMACNKSSFLNEKPSTAIVEPRTLSDMEHLLDNTVVFNFTGSLSQLAADEYELSDEGWQTGVATERNSYIWAKDIYGGDQSIQDWNQLYEEVLYANSVLSALTRSDSAQTTKGQQVRSWALFARSFAYFDLLRNFAAPYDEGLAETLPGVPLRLSPDIDVLESRTSMRAGYDRVIGDLKAALPGLSSLRPSGNLNRPSQCAAYALLARVFLDMRRYPEAALYADSALSMYNTLLDYKTISTSSATPFNNKHAELIYNARQVSTYLFTANVALSPATISKELLALYSPDDLRLQLYFTRNTDGTYRKKRGYNGSGNYPFSGLATDELYLIRAECLARQGDAAAAMEVLNALLVKRYRAGKFVSLQASSGAEALLHVLRERRKELAWRGTRWHDLKRLNKEGAGIELSRTISGTRYTLPANDPRYVFPIPDDEIALSGIDQNKR